MSELGKGAKALPFYIDASPDGRWVWANSFISNEVFVIDTSLEESMGGKMIEMDISDFVQKGTKSSRGDWNMYNSRPGGMVALIDGTALFTVYNTFGMLARVDATTEEIVYIEIPENEG